ncbi:hypothetical protein E2L08_16810 [Palleronia sediminis]|uniref:Uncharacterized protein n=1 Tax=Palleronia sediminis TaxID=2547833 RepID=A0A4R5ZQI6_9RHOB|nr:hypothetical protein [Palleronia sediminis]TDL72404.1 hypothetical protein E2L08_16810 [Palleronia sediminis]
MRSGEHETEAKNLDRHEHGAAKGIVMIPEISEFSYGFALTNEIVGWLPLSAAPVFPSLIEEGKENGGYDVKLDKPGAPLYLQFKRADYMTRSSATEIKHYGLPLSLPFHRFPITQRKKSFQHTSLVELDDGINLVFYAAPRFHMASEINDAWRSEQVAGRSIFVAPSMIGLIHDDDKHHVAYDAHHTYFCSEPKEISPLTASALGEKILERLASDSRPVRERLPEWLGNIRERRTQARQTQQKIVAEIESARRAARASSDGIDLSYVSVPIGRTALKSEEPETSAPSAPDIRESRALSPEEQTLRAISDEALHGFGAQLLVVQPKN